MAFVVHLSIAFALATTACMALLIARRWRAERAEGKIAARRDAVTRNYLRRIGGEQGSIVGRDDWEAIGAILHLGQLLRGAERDRLLELAEADGLVDLVLFRLRHGRTPRRIEAVRILGQLGSARAIARLQQVMAEGAHPELRLEAASALVASGRLPPPAETIALLGMGDGSLSRVHLALLRALAPHHFSELAALLDGELAPALRRMIVDALGWSGDYAAAQHIEQAASDPDPEVRCAALRAARQLGRPDAKDWILPLLDDADDAVRVNAIRACEALRIAAAVDRLATMRNDPSWWVRSRADDALAALHARYALNVAA